MIKQFTTLLGVCVIFLAFVSNGQAQENSHQPSQKTETTLSGESLKTVQGRSIDIDYSTFIAQPIDSAKLREWGQVNGRGSESMDILSTFLGLEDIANTFTFGSSSSSGSKLGVVLTHY